MEYLGRQICEDGVTDWRNNGGCVERFAHYADKPKWEDVKKPCPTTPRELREFCEAGNYGYEPPKKCYRGFGKCA